MDVSWITPALAIGTCLSAKAIDVLVREHQIGAVVDLRSESSDSELELDDRGVELLHLPAVGLAAVAPDMLRAGVGFATRHLAAGERVLLHCQRGIDRSGLLGLCVLVELGYSPLEALQLAMEKLSPTRAGYDAWAEWLHAHGHDVPSFERLAEIGY